MTLRIQKTIIFKMASGSKISTGKKAGTGKKTAAKQRNPQRQNGVAGLKALTKNFDFSSVPF